MKPASDPFDAAAFEKALAELVLPANLLVPDMIRTEHAACLEAFMAENQPGAYGHMAKILQHYHDANEHLPLPTEKLYMALLIKDAMAEDPAKLKAALEEIAADAKASDSKA